MEDLLILEDLPPKADEDLLVPFRNETTEQVPNKDNKQATEKLNPRNNENKPNNNDDRNKKREQSGRFRFFQKQSPDEKKDIPKKEEKKNLKVTTFAFPNAQVEHAEDHQEIRPQERKMEKSENGSLASDEEYEYVLEEVVEPSGGNNQVRSPRPRQECLKKLDDWDPSDNPYYQEESERRKNWKVEGFGSVPPPPNQDSSKDKNPVGRFLRRFRNNRSNRDPDLREMKVATEDTKDEMTLSEKIAKAALVVIAPEVYLEQEDGDDNKGVYRTIRTDVDDSASTSDNAGVALWDENKRLKKIVIKLEKEVKTMGLQVTSWKVRCNELEAELRRYKGQDSDDSSAEVIVEGDSDTEDDGIEEEWTGYNSVKEENLLDIVEEEHKPSSNSSGAIENLIDVTSDPEQKSTLDPPQASENAIDILTDECQNQVVVSTQGLMASFDPLAAKSDSTKTKDSLQLLETAILDEVKPTFDPLLEPTIPVADIHQLNEDTIEKESSQIFLPKISLPDMPIPPSSQPPLPPPSPPPSPPQSPSPLSTSSSFSSLSPQPRLPVPQSPSPLNSRPLSPSKSPPPPPQPPLSKSPPPSSPKQEPSVSPPQSPPPSPQPSLSTGTSPPLSPSSPEQQQPETPQQSPLFSPQPPLSTSPKSSPLSPEQQQPMQPLPTSHSPSSQPTSPPFSAPSASNTEMTKEALSPPSTTSTKKKNRRKQKKKRSNKG